MPENLAFPHPVTRQLSTLPRARPPQKKKQQRGRSAHSLSTITVTAVRFSHDGNLEPTVSENLSLHFGPFYDPRV